MIYIKTEEEIELMKQSNMLVSETLAQIARIIQPGVSTLQLDKLAEEFLRDHGGVPGFLGYDGFPNTLCTSVNSAVVHGIPSDYRLEDGDIISVDCGVKLNGFFGDSAYTFEVGTVDLATHELLETTKEALFVGIELAQEGNRLGDIGHAIQQHAEERGYSVVREMVGHGLGKYLHEEPEVPNYGRRGSGIKLKKGMVFCLEPMINMGDRYIRQDPDGWTIRTSDNKPSAHFELAVAVTKGEPVILSTFDLIEVELKNKSS
ncbi:MAG: type I methionyl aminopeptidase [Bacteroidales bacterium]|nr:type I methionyl aminopeptidase [Bacteroidales bacterium]